MKLTVSEARRLSEQTLVAAGYTEDEADRITQHIMDTELRGLDYGGLARTLSIFERTTKPGYERSPIEVVHETPLSALVDGHNTIGYLVARYASDLCIEKASEHGMAVVGARDTWHTGMLSFFAEMAAERDLISMIASNAAPNTAPFGGTEGRFGTNPICFGFPSSEAPVIWDIGTSNIMHGEAVLAERLGVPLPDGVAYDADGILRLTRHQHSPAPSRPGVDIKAQDLRSPCSCWARCAMSPQSQRVCSVTAASS